MIDGEVVIVGGGQGGLQAAISLRQEGHTGPITILGGEEGLPYQRPPLSKEYLKTGEAGKLALRPASFFEKKEITLRSGTWVDRIDRQNRRVHVGDDVLHFDHLILATGTRNLVPPIPGAHRALGLRTLDDARVLREALHEERRIVVIGGGFIGLEFAAVARGAGHDVTVAEVAPRLMSRVLSPVMSDRFRHLHDALGTKLELGNGATEVTGEGVVLADGKEVPADIVLLAAGVCPNTELAEDAGLDVGNGIVVDGQLRTADRNIYALGDCAVFPEPRTQRPVRLESVQAATDHARTIAKSIVHGATDPYAAVPWFWSDQADWKLQIAGLASPDDDCVPVGDTTVLRFERDRLTAVETINDAKAHMKARKLLALDAAPTKAQMAEFGFDLALT